VNQFDIPSGTLYAAVNQWSQVADIAVDYTGEDDRMDAINTGRVNGRMSALYALNQLIGLDSPKDGVEWDARYSGGYMRIRHVPDTPTTAVK
jgi:hypothetical protein